MPILKPKAPTETAAAFTRQLPEFVSLPDDRSVRKVRPEHRQEYVGSAPEAPTLADLRRPRDLERNEAQQVYMLGLDAAAGDDGASAATPAGWRFFAGHEPGKILMGSVTRRNPELGWKMTAGFYGDRVWSAFTASNALDQLPQVEAADYELRMLAVPGLNLEAFWLVAQDSKSTDLVIPFPAGAEQPIEVLKGEAVYSMASFLAIIRPLAQLRLQAERQYGG